MYDLDWLYGRQNWKIGLEAIRALLTGLGNPQTSFKSVLIGGTNGKGSTAATLASILTAAGHKTGLFTSPHLTRFTERFRCDGVEISEEDVQKLLDEIGPYAERLGASFFEIVTALACLHFRNSGVDFAVMEVGLGGRLDATNALDPEISIITHIAHDHTHILGHTLTEIAREKAGIMRQNRLCLTSATGEACKEIKRVAQQKESRLWCVGREIQVSAEARGRAGWDMAVTVEKQTICCSSPLLGKHQVENTALAVSAALALGVSEEAIVQGTQKTSWSGRLEFISWKGKTLLLDGAHNPSGIQMLIEGLQNLDIPFPPLIFGASADKDLSEMGNLLRPHVKTVILTQAEFSSRAKPASEMVPFFPDARIFIARNPRAALEQLGQITKHLNTLESPVGVVAGSLYLIGEVRGILKSQSLERRLRTQ